jgi:DNA-binding NarL/FixJ family response regulator
MRVAICDDGPLWRRALATGLAECGVEVTTVAGSASELVGGLDVRSTDVVVLDLHLTRQPTRGSRPEGLDVAARLRERAPRIGVLLLSAYLDATHVVELLRDGEAGLGALNKDRVDDLPMLIERLERLAAGGTVVDESIAGELIFRRSRQQAIVELLSKRQVDVLMLIAEGLSNYGIAQRLSIGERTVEGVTKAVFQKMGLADDRLGNRRVLAAIEWLKSSPYDSERRLRIAPRQ